MILVPPRFATPRTPDRATLGPAVSRAALSLGFQLMPHQQLVSDVAGEVLPSGRMAYPVVVVLMPRRGGKTKLLLPTFLQRASMIPDARCWYTAQTGGDAGLTFKQEWLPALDGLSQRGHLSRRLSNGSESFTLTRSRSRVGVFSPTPSSLHGQDADTVGVDEGWSFSRAKGAALMQAIKPAQLTRPQRQLWIISAGGDDTSEWLLDWRELGRALTGPDQGVAFFEWHPEVVAKPGNVGGYDLAPHVDLDDPAVWASTHPAVGNTVTVEALAEDRSVFGADEFNRAYLNVFQTGAADRVLPRIAWERNTDPDYAPTEGYGTVVTFDVAPGSESAAVIVCRRADDGLVDAELVEHRDGSAWVADRARQLAHRMGASIAADGKGPNAVVIAELVRDGVPVDQLDAARVAAAADQLLAALLNDRIRIRQTGALDRAAASAAARILGDGWAFTRRRSSGDITPVVALSVAHHAALASVDGAVIIEGA